MIIAIDGPAGAGKSTVAKKLADKLKFFYVDTGAMYRALTLKVIRLKIDFADSARIIEIAKQTKIELKRDSDRGEVVLLDGQDVSAEIRDPEVTNSVFHVARMPQIRGIMVFWQRNYGNDTDIVMEGRDIGTVVFPNAGVKFYLDASVMVRAERRFKELREKGKDVDLDRIVSMIIERDEKDKNRSCGPLKQAEDAVYVDTSNLNIDQVVAKLCKAVKNKNEKR